MMKRIQYIGLTCTAVLMFLVGWVTATPKPMYDAAPGSLAREYTSMAQLIKDTPYIFEVEVETDPETIDHDGVLFSKNQVKIVNELKGTLGTDKVTILDNGGVYNGKEYGMGGMPLLHSGDKYLLFLYEYQGPVTDEHAYMIQGVWQGKIKINSIGQLEYVGPSEDTQELHDDIKKNNRMNNIKTLIENLK